MKVESNVNIEAHLHCRRAILVYENEKQTEALLTLNPVLSNKNGKLTIQAGQLLTRETIHNVLRSLNNGVGSREILSRQILITEPDLLVWWCPGEIRPIYFSTGDKEFNRAVNGKKIPYPPLLFAAQAGRLYVWALTDNRRPSAQTPLMMAPFYNLYNNGAMCRGNTPYPANTFPSSLPHWEAAFFETQFTHSNYRTLFLKKPMKHNDLMRDLVKSKAKEFPLQHLVPSIVEGDGKGVTLGEVVQSL